MADKLKSEKINNHLVFVVQKHDAQSLHFDFRLQIGDVMPSWAIPKGPTMDPAMKRLAMETSDHELEYRNFEGKLPEGEYGAGPVMIWDEGYYLPEIEISKGVREVVEGTKEGSVAMGLAFKKGELKFRLFGKKLAGSFALVKTKGFGGPKAWLMIKHNDEFIKKGFDAHKLDFSARTKKTLQEIADGK